jgi:general secretion pathway protein G
MDALPENHRIVLKRRVSPPAGFSLVEILVVVAIIGILAALIAPRLLSRPDEARVTAAKQGLASMVSALKLYRLDNFRYPSQEQGLRALVERPTTEPVPVNWPNGGYLDRFPKDPWGNDYVYRNPGQRDDVEVLSLGADGRPGGTGVNADITSEGL